MIKQIRYITTAFMLLLSTIAVANIDEPKFPELERDERYMSLKHENELLVEREDSIQLLITEARNSFNITRDTLLSPEELDRHTSYILMLEEQVFEIRKQRGNVVNELTNIEQEYILAHMYAPVEEFDNLADQTTTEEVVEKVIQHRRLIDNTIVINSLDMTDYIELQQAQEEDEAMLGLIDEYATTYANMRETITRYNEATEEVVADSLFNAFEEMAIYADDLSQLIDGHWNHIIDTKYYAYGYILEKNYRYNLLDNSSAEFTTMQQECASNDGEYASDAIMHYAIGRSTLVTFERDFAREMELTEAADSLQLVLDSIKTPDYQYTPLSLERRLFIDYKPIIIGRTNYYTSSNPVPEMRIYERGTIYRILLGTFRNKPPMTLFKGVQPLYIIDNEDGYNYYAGGFKTLKEAEEAQIFLREKGFKQPEICRWKDGEMVNIDSIDEQEDTEVVVPVGHRYMVMLECDSLSESMRATISSTSPDKMITRRGAQFAIGTFTDHSEADILLSTIEEKHPEIKASIIELNL